MTKHHIPRTTVLFALGAAALLGLSSCGESSSGRIERETSAMPPIATAQKLVLPAGISDPAKLLDALNASPVPLRLSPSLSSEGVMTFFPNGDSSYVNDPGRVSVFNIAGVEYARVFPAGSQEPVWFFAGDPYALGLHGLGDMVANHESTIDSISVKESADGYELTITRDAIGTVDRVNLTLDADRSLTALTFADGLDVEDPAPPLSMAVTYPTDVTSLSAPSSPRPQKELAGFLAQETVRSAATMVADMLATTPVAELSARMFSDALADLNPDVYVDVETAFDADSVGFANNSRQVELVSSDGVGVCYRATVSAAGDTVDVARGSDGASGDMGFMCSTGITHVGDRLYE